MAGSGCRRPPTWSARTARVCPATAAVLPSHYAAVAVIESYGGPWVRGEIAAGRHLASLALAEGGSGEQEAEARTATRAVASRPSAPPMWSPCGRVSGEVVAAGEADSYLWSSRPLAGPDGLTLWVVPAHAPDLFVPARPGAGGPRGSATSTVFADPVLVPADVDARTRTAEGSTSCCGTVRPWLLELRAAVGTPPPDLAGATLHRAGLDAALGPALGPAPSTSGERPPPGRRRGRVRSAMSLRGPSVSPGSPRRRAACGRSRWCARCACA